MSGQSWRIRGARGAWRPLKAWVWLGRWLDRGVIVLAFHHIPPGRQATLAGLIDFLKSRRCLLSPQAFAHSWAKGGRDLGRGVVLTFDDGFASQYRVALEVLEPLGLKAAFFIVPEFLDCRRRADQQRFIARRLFGGRILETDVPDHMASMTWAEAADLIKRGHLIGAHGLSHQPLSRLGSQSRIEAEISGSGNALEARLGQPIDHFALPFGKLDSVDRRVMEEVKGRYRFCYSSISGVNRHGRDPHALLRLPVPLEEPLDYVCFVAENGLGWRYLRQSRGLARLARRTAHRQ